MAEVKETKKERPKKRHVRFYQYYNNINVVGETFNNIRLTVFETIAESVEDAYEEFKTQLIMTRKNSPKEVEDFIKRLFGGKILAEVIDKSGIKEETLTL